MPVIRPGLSEDEAKHLVAMRGYLREAWKLKAEAHGQELEVEPENDAYERLDGNTRRLVEKLSNSIFSAPHIPEDKTEIPFGEEWDAERIEAFLTEHYNLSRQQIVNDLLGNELFEELEKRKKTAEKFQQLSVPLLAVSSASYRASQTRVPPVDWFFLGLSMASAVAGSVAEYMAARKDPDIVRRKKVKREALSNILVSVGCAVTFIIGVMGGAPLAGAVVFAASLLPVCAQNLVSLARSIKRLIAEVRDRKVPKVSYAWRVAKRVATCVHKASNASFYTFALVAAGVLVFGLVTANPIGAVLVGAILPVAIASVSLSAVSGFFNKTANSRIRHLENNGPRRKKGKSVSNKPRRSQRAQVKPKMRAAKEQRASLVAVASKVNRPVQTLARGKPKIKRMYQRYRSQQRSETPAISFRTVETYSTPKFTMLHRDCLQKLSQRKAAKNDLYQDIFYNVNGVNDTRITVQVPKGQNMHDMKRYDRIEQSLTPQHNMEITLSGDPGDQAIHCLLDLHRDFQPLALDYCGEPLTVLKVAQAAKLADVTLHFDPRDKAEIKKCTDQKVAEEFNALELVDPKDYARVFAAKPLGELTNHGIIVPPTKP